MTAKGWVIVAILYNLLMVSVWQLTGFGWVSLLVGFLIEIICALVILIYYITPRWPG